MSLFGPPNVDKMKARKDVNGLIKALSYNKDHDIRQAAANALGELKDKRAVDALIEVLNDQDWEMRKINKPVRQAAARALGHIGDLRAVEPLGEALLDYKMEISGPASEALIEIGDPSAVEPVMAVMARLVSFHQPDYAYNVLFALGKSAVPRLIPFLEDKESDVRYTTSDILGRIGDRRAVEPLIPLLKDKQESTRTVTARGLGLLGDPRAVEPLIQALDDPWWYLHPVAATALAEIGDRRAVEPIIAKFEKQQMLNKEFALALGKLGDERAIQPLAARLRNDPDNRHGENNKVIMEALAMLGNPAVETIRHALEQEHVRQYAAQALEKIGTPEAMQALATYT